MCSTPTNFNFHVVIEEEVSQLEISVHNVALMEVLATKDYLPQEVAGLRLGDVSATLVQLHHGLQVVKRRKKKDCTARGQGGQGVFI